MIKEALQYIVGLGKTEVQELDGQLFSTQPLHTIDEARVAAINVNSLSGMVEYLKSKFDGNESLLVHVVSPTKVVCFDTFNRDKKRNTYITAEAMTPNFSFDRWYPAEEFNIQLQACFVNSPATDRAAILRVVGNIKEDEVRTYGDDGVSQSVTAKAGIANVEDVKVPNPVCLMPFRTFVEVDQPASEFVFRMQSGPKCALFEADGGAWKLEAMQNIKTYLQIQLNDEIAQGKIVVIA